MNFIANFWFALIFGILSVIALGITIWLLFDEYESKLFALIPAAFLILFVFGWQYSATHRVVPVNERWVIVNKLKAEVQGPVRSSGLTTKPIIGSRIIKFPGATEQQFCITYYPALKEGYEIFADICGNYDASSMDWKQLYLKYNFTTEEEMLNYWANQSKEEVSLALQGVDYTKITTERPAVSAEIRSKLSAWFDQLGVTVINIKLSNWDFTSEEVKKQVDQASAASMQKTIETQLYEAAILARTRQLYEVETANLVLGDRGLALQSFFEALGIEDDNAKAQLGSQMTWFSYAESPPEGVQIILSVGGGGNIPISIPIDLGEDVLPEPTPQENE